MATVLGVRGIVRGVRISGEAFKWYWPEGPEQRGGWPARGIDRCVERPSPRPGQGL